jgi:hypothetical protein
MAVGGCSGPQTPGTEEPEGIGGDPFASETTGEGATDTEQEGEAVAPDTPAEPEEAPAAAKGPGRLRINIKASGEPARAKVRIMTADVEPEVVAEGTAPHTFEVASGTYDVEATLLTTLDRPQKRLTNVRVPAHDVEEREVVFTVGKIVLQPMRGRAKVGKRVRWRYAGGGDWFEQDSRAGQEVLLSTGRYDAEVTVGRTAITIQDVQVYEGKRTVTAPIN